MEFSECIQGEEPLDKVLGLRPPHLLCNLGCSLRTFQLTRFTTHSCESGTRPPGLGGQRRWVMA